MDLRDAEEARAAADNLVKGSPRYHDHEEGDSDDNDTHTSASKDMCETEKELSTEQMFQNRKVPPWWQQITFRGVIVSFMISVLLSIIVMKLNLTTGIIPSVNVSAGLLGFFLIRSYTEILDRARILRTPFTRQENTMIQTCIVAAVSISFSGIWHFMVLEFRLMIAMAISYLVVSHADKFRQTHLDINDSDIWDLVASSNNDRIIENMGCSVVSEERLGIYCAGGFGSYLFAMSPKVYQQTGDVKGNNPDTVKEPGLGWIIGFLFIVSFLGLFSVVALRKIMIIDYKLTYPSGTATAVLINGFHTPAGARMAGKQLVYLGRFFGLSFLWSFFQWFYAGGDECGFNSFPTLGLNARNNRFYFDFNMTYVGAGMICPHKVNLSLMAGGILSWGIMWPLLKKKEGDWYPAGNNSNQNDMQGLHGYKVFIAIALILGDGLYTFVKILCITMITMAKDYKRRQKKLMTNGVDEKGAVAEESISFDERKRTEVFLKDSIPNWLAVLVYVVLATVSICVIPKIFKPMKWYFVLVAYLIAPFLAFCNAYGCGLTDWSLASSYGKIAIFIFGAWAGDKEGGVLAGLVACGVTMSIVSTASDLTQDMKTGYMTLSSPRSMLVSQIIGTAMGCVIAPCIFWLFYTAFDIGGGGTSTDYAVPFGITYRNMAILGVEGFRALPHNCITFCGAFFALAIFLNVLRDRLPPRLARLVPLPTAMAIPFYLGAYFAIDMLVGSAVVAAWHKLDPSSAHQYSMSVASGLLCGDGVWTLPASVLALANIKAPICMKFLSGSQNQRVNAFLTHHE